MNAALSGTQRRRATSATPTITNEVPSMYKARFSAPRPRQSAKIPTAGVAPASNQPLRLRLPSGSAMSRMARTMFRRLTLQEATKTLRNRSPMLCR